MPYTAPATKACDTASFVLYFQNAEALLSDQARAVILAARDRLDGCAISQVSMIAASDDARSQTERVTLASDRISMVLDALRNSDLTAEAISARIEQGPTPVFAQAQTMRPMARRVAVTLTAYNPELG